MTQGFAIANPGSFTGSTSISTVGTITSGTWLGTSITKVAEGRLTLTSGTPVTTSDVTAATTIYYTPYKGNRLSLYNGTNWVDSIFTQFSIAVPATTATMYDIWAYLSGSTPTLELLSWTNDTTRATALTTQDGVYVKSGDATRRYLGSFRTTGVSGQTEDSLAKRWLYNYYNRTCKSVSAIDTTNSWTYSGASPGWRQANANTANQLDFIQGVVEDQVFAQVTLWGPTSSVSAKLMAPGIGVNSTSSNSAITFTGIGTTSPGYPGLCSWVGFGTTGRNYIAWLEQRDNSGGGAVQTYYGDNGASLIQSGIVGHVIV